MHPPGPGNGKAGTLAKAPGPHEKLISDTADKIDDSTREGKLWLANVELLRSRGIKYDHRTASRDIVTTCPACGAKLVIDETEPFWLCTGDFLCPANRRPFREVVAALVEKAVKT